MTGRDAERTHEFAQQMEHELGMKVEAVYSRDFPLVQGGVLTLAVIYVCVNFAADIVYMILNPRVKL